MTMNNDDNDIDYDDLDIDAAELCRLAGRDPDEKLTIFTMQDFAGVVAAMGVTQEEAVKMVARVDATSLGDSICDASGWSDILETRADMELEEVRKTPEQLAAEKAADLEKMLRIHGMGQHYSPDIWAGLGCTECAKLLPQEDK
jgi:hypothetical protein